MVNKHEKKVLSCQENTHKITVRQSLNTLQNS